MTNSEGNEPTPQDIVSVLRGHATPAQVAKIRSALDDSNSDLNAWLHEVENWAQSALRSPQSEITADRSVSERPGKLGRVIEFLREQQQSGVLSADDVSQVISAAGISAVDLLLPKSARQDFLTAARIEQAVSQHHPELLQELSRRGSERGK